MRIVRLTASLLFALAASCSGGTDSPGTFAVPTTSPPTAGQQPVSTVAPGKLRPPAVARLFAGTASQAGQLIRHCKNQTCEESPARTPVFLSAPAGGFVMFTLGETPVEARAEVRVGPSARPATVKLEPSTLMVFNHGLGKGRYLVDLLVRWRASEARWRFGLNLR